MISGADRGRPIDILFANEQELAALTGVEDFHPGLDHLAPRCTVVVTRSEKGAHAIRNGEHAHVPAQPVEQVVDTTGAGDLFAAGFLFGHVRGLPLETCLLGAVRGRDHLAFGARPEADLKALVALVRLEAGGRENFRAAP
jgi:sugar/nucleoside kinase (ribokinase family)